MAYSGFGKPTINLEPRPTGSDLATALAHPVDDAAEVRFWWLGQAGFAFRFRDALLLIDPYLSDSLSAKYQTGEFKHLRMMPVPVEPGQIIGCNWYLCTHAHTDHMDPETIRGVQARGTPLFVVPRAAAAVAAARGVPEARLLTINAGETAELGPSVALEALPSAHESLDVDGAGHHRYLGYVISFSRLRLYHAGDCVPYPGLAAELARRQVDMAFLPINGRDAHRSSRGVPGNFTLVEALELCRSAGIPYLICHHFGMFEFNTIDPAAARAILATEAGPIRWLLPEIGQTYDLKEVRAS